MDDDDVARQTDERIVGPAIMDRQDPPMSATSESIPNTASTSVPPPLPPRRPSAMPRSDSGASLHARSRSLPENGLTTSSEPLGPMLAPPLPPRTGQTGRSPSSGRSSGKSSSSSSSASSLAMGIVQAGVMASRPTMSRRSTPQRDIPIAPLHTQIPQSAPANETHQPLPLAATQSPSLTPPPLPPRHAGDTDGSDVNSHLDYLEPPPIPALVCVPILVGLAYARVGPITLSVVCVVCWWFWAEWRRKDRVRKRGTLEPPREMTQEGKRSGGEKSDAKNDPESCAWV
jgi:hypothetical protein